jgi:hypothetical protein
MVGSNNVRVSTVYPGIEKKWPAVPPQLFTADGSPFGIITIASTLGFKVKQNVSIAAVGQSDHNVRVIRVMSLTQMKVGAINPPQGKWFTGIDVSAYTVAAGAYVYANEQDKVPLKLDDIDFAVYDQEPTVAIRSVLVDQLGDYYASVVDSNGLNRLAVDAAVTVTGITIALDAFTKTPPDNVLIVGSEDGTETGIKHALVIDSNLDAHVVNMADLITVPFDSVMATNSVISGQTVPTTVQYYSGGLSGILVATLTVTYDSNANFVSVSKTPVI